MSGFVAGAKTTFTDANDHILDLRNGLDFLSPTNDGIGLLKKIGTNGFTAKSFKHEWAESTLATRGETITLADGTGTSVTVSNAYQYTTNELIKVEAEVMRVTAIASATVLTVVRGYAGTTGAAHAAKLAYTLGSADPENSQAGAGVNDYGDRFYNYIQTFTRPIQLSNDEIAQWTTEGNALDGQLKRRFIEANRQLARALFYGVRYEDTGNLIHTMGGLTQYVTSNVTNVGGALTLAAIDAQILNIVLAGGIPNAIAVHPTQKQKLDALDANKQLLGKQEHTGGNLITQTWQSGILDSALEVFVDQSILPDQLWILDTTKVKIGSLTNNGVEGAFHVEDATTPGQDGQRRVIRGKYTARVEQQKAHGYLYGLS